ncbi:unnamed protein product [Alopecurus aequalis]
MAKLEIPTIESLPVEMRYPLFPVRQYGGFWLPEFIFPGIVAIHGGFAPRPDDVFLGSFPKSGTTWLKALAFATLHREKHPPSWPEHPLRNGSPHDCVKFVELSLSGADELAALPSPRVLATHLPYTLLPGSITAGGRIVYVCREPKDALVSWWLFTKKTMAAAGGEPPFTIEEAFDLFCDGRCPIGPHWDHVLGYWEESQKRPEKVLFLWYEKMLQDPLGNVRRLAEFMGCPFSGEEEASGVVQDIVELCSLDTLKNMDANKMGSQQEFKNESFFRKGVAGDWEQPHDAVDGGATGQGRRGRAARFRIQLWPR